MAILHSRLEAEQLRDKYLSLRGTKHKTLNDTITDVIIIPLNTEEFLKLFHEGNNPDYLNYPSKYYSVNIVYFYLGKAIQTPTLEEYLELTPNDEV